MQRLRKIFNFYVKASIHVALAAVSFVYLTCQFLNIPENQNLLFFVFFGSIPAYNFIKRTLGGKNRFYGLLSIEKNILWLSVISLLLAGYFGLSVAWITWQGVIVLSILAAFYALPVLPQGKNLRHSGIIKIFIIGLVWAGITVVLPVLEAKAPMNWDVWVEFTQRFLIILVLMVPFEIRDLSTDPNDMLTIPQRFGISATRRMGFLICIFCFLFTFLKDELSDLEIVSKAVMTASLMAMLAFLPKKQSEYFASFWVEAFPIFWAGLLWVFLYLF